MLQKDSGNNAVTDEPQHPSVNPAAMHPEALARLLNVRLDTVQAHVAAGAPTAPDGTISLVHYAAWLNQELNQRNHGD